MSSSQSNQLLFNKNNPQINSNSDSHFNNPSSISLLDNQNNQSNRKNNFAESNLSQYINDSIYEEIKYQNEAKEVLNELRSKYLPNSIKRSNYSINNNQNNTYFNNKNNSNLYFSTFTEYNNAPNISTEKIDYYKTQKENSRFFQSSFLDNKDLNNFNESIKINSENIKNSNLSLDKPNESFLNKRFENNNKIEEKTYFNDYLIKENEKLKKLNKNYELLITPLIEYINDINYFFGQNVIDFHNINNLIKNKELNNDYNSLNDLKSFLKITKNNIIDSCKNRRSNSNPNNQLSSIKQNLYNSAIINNNHRSFTFNRHEKEFEINNYKPIIADRKSENFENNIFKSFDMGSIKRAKTFKENMPKTFWSQNKKVKFKK
jgi:hypothetical protein